MTTQLLISHVEDHALCVVCRDHPAKRNGYYCSNACWKQAYNYRKRLMDVKHFLTGLEFVLTYSSGIILNTRLPLSISWAYPKTLSQFAFVQPMIAVESVNAAHYWAALDDILGLPVGSFINWQYDRRDRYDWKDARELLQGFVKTCHEDIARYFNCGHCGKRYIISGMSRAHDSSLCNDCIVSEHPF